MGYEKLTSEEKQFYTTKLENILSSKKLFLNINLSLLDLVEETGIQLHIISFIVNNEFNLHFKDYINMKRIAYFKEKISTPQWKDLTVDKMILAAGFRSRTTCYRAFMKHVGMTPSKYLKNTQ
jgi:methylphosphotriester-DNA--protein-cysteine methyltransferase